MEVLTVNDPTRPSDGPAWEPLPPLASPGAEFVRDLTHEILAFFDRRAMPLAETLAEQGDDPGIVVVFIIETLRGLADGFELGSLAD